MTDKMPNENLLDIIDELPDNPKLTLHINDKNILDIADDNPDGQEIEVAIFGVMVGTFIIGKHDDGSYMIFVPDCNVINGAGDNWEPVSNLMVKMARDKKGWTA